MSEPSKEIDDLFSKQFEITWGSYFLKMVGDVDEGTSMVILGHCLTQEEIVDAETDAGASATEVAHYMDRRVQNHQNGLRYGPHYSQAEPLGELGSSHILECWPITEEDFNFSKEHGWLLSPDALDRIENEMEQARSEIGKALEKNDENVEELIRDAIRRVSRGF